jgi:hypothetical protein
MSAFVWTTPPNFLRDNAHIYLNDVRAETFNVLREMAPDAERRLKQTAPWTNRSGKARLNLSAVFQSDSPISGRLILSHGVFYGVFLENSNGGVYAVIRPISQEIGLEVMRRLQQMVK